MSDLISIIMPAKNAEAYLVSCLDSILKQSYNNWELLVVNDHSEDNTPIILQNYADLDNRIYWFNNKGNGIIPALKLAYANSNGAFITRMDADDLMSKDKLKLLHKGLSNAGKGVVATGLVKYFPEQELGEGFKKYETWLNGLTYSNSNFSEIYKECVIPSPCWMIHRDDFDRTGGFDSLVYPEDYDLCFRMYASNLGVVGVPETLHLWRDHSARASRNDSNYADNNFLELKVHYFLKTDFKENKKLVLWGAGRKGKQIAQMLKEKQIDFTWLCDNPKKIGKEIYEVELKSDVLIDEIAMPQVIIAVANEEEQSKIKVQLNGKESYFFC